MKAWMLGALAALSMGSGALAQDPPPPVAPLASASPQLPADPPTGIVEDPCPTRNAARDWANLCKYRAANAALPPPAAGQPRVVFMGDSITENWVSRDPAFFQGTGYVGRGISGQTTPQMLVRFQADVVALHPAVVHIMAGTNDVAGNTGPSTYQAVEDNIVAMATLARANGIKVVLASIPPAADFPWRHGLDPSEKIARLNAWLRDYAAHEGFTYVDYFPALADGTGAMRAELGEDGVHPLAAGYRAMEPLTQAAIAQALRARR